MRFEKASRTFGDETARYRVYDVEQGTVGEFVDYVVRKYPNEWGYFYISNYPMRVECEYRWGRVVTPFPSDLLELPITSSFYAYGGWGMMDYFIMLDE